MEIHEHKANQQDRIWYVPALERPVFSDKEFFEVPFDAFQPHQTRLFFLWEANISAFPTSIQHVMAKRSVVGECKCLTHPFEHWLSLVPIDIGLA